jgi:hypothetical protein
MGFYKSKKASLERGAFLVEYLLNSPILPLPNR